MHDLNEVPSIWREIPISGIKVLQKILKASGVCAVIDDEALTVSERTEHLLTKAILIAEPHGIRLFMRRKPDDMYEAVAEVRHSSCSFSAMLGLYDSKMARLRKNRADAGLHESDPQSVESIYLYGREYLQRELYGYSVPSPRTRAMLLTREDRAGGSQ
jgi:hypothetical protein